MYATKYKQKSEFNARLAGQVAAFFATKETGQSISVLKLIKLIYLADRESIAQQGCPIMSDQRFALDHGPVNSQTLNNIKHDRPVDLEVWSEYMTAKEGNYVRPAKTFTFDDFDELSESDIDILYEVWKKFGHMSPWELRQWTHDKKNLPEYDEPPKGKRTDITLETIYDTLGVSKFHLRDIEGFKAAEKLFSPTA